MVDSYLPVQNAYKAAVHPFSLMDHLQVVHALFQIRNIQGVCIGAEHCLLPH